MTLRFPPPPGLMDLSAFPDDSSLSTGPISIGFLSAHNPYDRSAFSGTAFYAAQALDAQPGIHFRILGPHAPPGLISKLQNRLLGRPAPQPTLDNIDLSGLDVVVGLVASGLLDGLGQHHDIPYLHVTDATPDFLSEHYGMTVPPDAIQQEKRVAQNADAVLYSSAYMARRARREISPGIRAQCLPFGMNFDALPADLPPRPIPASDQTPVQMLFVCTDWDRKGGDLALGALRELQAQGLDARLTIVGKAPAHVDQIHGVDRVGFLNKNRPAERARLCDLYTRAHVFLLPTRGDCTPMVLAEAMAHGAPVLATDIGGIREIIGSEGGGRLLSMTADARDWARAIFRLTKDQPHYQRASRAAFETARHRLCWTSWAKGVENQARQAKAHRAKARQSRRLHPLVA